MKIKSVLIMSYFLVSILNVPRGFSQKQGHYIEEEVTSPPIFGMAGGKTLTRTWILDDKIRRDEEDKLQTTIIRSDLGQIWIVNHGDSSYREVSQEMFQGLAMIGLMMFGVTFDSLTGEPIVPEPLFRKTGSAMQIGKWSAREYVVVPKGEGSVPNSMKRLSLWLSRDAGLDSSIYSRMMRKMFGDLGSDYDGFFRQLESLEGYPVLVETRMMGMEMRQKLIKVEKKTISESLFDVPRGYKKQAIDF
jgi:hypothetical protein